MSNQSAFKDYRKLATSFVVFSTFLLSINNGAFAQDASITVDETVAEEVPVQEEEALIELIDPVAVTEEDNQIVLNDISFYREGEAANISLAFAEEIPAASLVESEGKVTVIFDDTVVSDDQYVQIDVSQFGTSVNSIESFQLDDSASVEIETVGNVKIEKADTASGYVVSIHPKTPEEIEEESAEEDVLYSGSPITLNFQDVPVRQVLQIIAQVNGFNLVTTDTVTGNVTINLDSVPWDQALDMILEIRGLGKKLEGNILLVAPAAELAARETQQLQSQQQVQALAELKTANIVINYAKASDLAAILASENGSILSERGAVSVDERTNTLLIRDIQASIDNARELIEILDIPVKQVLIESRMVTVREDFDEQLGVRWGFTGRGSESAVSGTIRGVDAANSGVVPDLTDRLNVNLPVASPAGRIGFQVASLMDGNILDLELSALESENKGEIIASPRITVANQQEAYIEQGTEIPFVQAASSGATAVEFKKAVLSLKVTPQITPDNRIILDLVVTQDTRGETVQTSTGPAVAIDTQEIKTQVLVENGETIVLGGIFQQTTTDDVSKVPLFGDLPVVGSVFRTTQQLEAKRELLIFVTPKIVTEGI
ncbi:MAG: type IV pilus secretin PilQ family protein [Pseudomonadota bacterium]